MPDPRVWNIRDPNCPKDAVLIDRRTKWGNPIKISKVRSRAESIRLYREYIHTAMNTKFLNPRELRGKDLKCWCAPLSCHGDVLLELANA